MLCMYTPMKDCMDFVYLSMPNAIITYIYTSIDCICMCHACDTSNLMCTRSLVHMITCAAKV